VDSNKAGKRLNFYPGSKLTGITEFRYRPPASTTHLAADDLIIDISPLQAKGISYLLKKRKYAAFNSDDFSADDTNVGSSTYDI
jgi:hypothetical protein